MLTVKRIVSSSSKDSPSGGSGFEAIISAEYVMYYPNGCPHCDSPRSLSAFGVVGASLHMIGEGSHMLGEVNYTSGRIYVMNDSGKTVANYDLD
jgi:hypothetical protein